MSRNQHTIPAGGAIVLLLALLNGIILKDGYINDSRHYGWLLVTVPLLAAAVYNSRQ